MSGTGPVPAAHTTIPHAISSIGDTSSSMHSSTAPDGSSMHRRMTTRRGVGTSTTRLNAVAEKPSRDMIKGLTKPKDDTEYAAPPSVSDVLRDQTYAIVEVGGTQLIVQEGRQYVVNHLNVRPRTVTDADALV